MLANRDAEALQRIHDVAVPVRQRPAQHLADTVGVEGKRPLGGDFWVELANAAGRTVARVDQCRPTAPALALVVALKSGRLMYTSPRISSRGEFHHVDAVECSEWCAHSA